jgi:hypothetical protein
VIIREQPSGAINVYIGSEPLIQSGSTRGITTSDEVDGEFVRTVVRFRDTNARINVGGRHDRRAYPGPRSAGVRPHAGTRRSRQCDHHRGSTACTPTAKG